MKFRVISCLATLMGWTLGTMRLARSSRYSFTSVRITLRAPQWPATIAAIMPMGPAPVMMTSSPTILNDKAV